VDDDLGRSLFAATTLPDRPRDVTRSPEAERRDSASAKDVSSAVPVTVLAFSATR